VIYRFLLNLLVYLSGLASLLGLYFTRWPDDNTRPGWHWAALAGVSIMFIVLFFVEAKRIAQESHKTFFWEWSINRYMANWVSRLGRSVILSRDLSWGDTPKARSALISKARKGDLTIYLATENDLSRELAEAGAEIVYYGHTGFMPKSRFTVIGFGQDVARVAVGSQRKGRRIVYEYDTGEHPITALSEDLTSLLTMVGKK